MEAGQVAGRRCDYLAAGASAAEGAGAGAASAAGAAAAAGAGAAAGAPHAPPAHPPELHELQAGSQHFGSQHCGSQHFGSQQTGSQHLLFGLKHFSFGSLIFGHFRAGTFAGLQQQSFPPASAAEDIRLRTRVQATTLITNRFNIVNSKASFRAMTSVTIDAC